MKYILHRHKKILQATRNRTQPIGFLSSQSRQPELN
uniref:Uncharacterized protein n=1 Tax=Arundo donax TaxID=35708 RepID=A0A0A9HBG6_ARUDO